MEETERIDETDAIMFDFQQFAPIPELLDNAVVAVALMDNKVPIVPLEIMGQHMDLTRVVQREGIQPFEEIAVTMFAWETHGVVVVFGFGYEQIGDVLFVGLHGFNVKKHVQGRQVVHVVLLLLLRFMGWKPCGGPSFGARTSLTFTFAFLLFLFLRGEGSLNETTVGFAVHVLAAGRTIRVPALMSLNSFQPYILFETFRTATSTKANRGLGAGGRFALMVFGTMGLVTRVSEKVAKAVLATSRGFQTPWVSLQEIGAGFLATGPAKVFSFAAPMLSFVVIGFPTVGTHVTGPEKSRQTGNDIVMVFLVEQDQLFVLSVSKPGDMEEPVGIHQQDLVIGEGRHRTEDRQGIVPSRTEGNVGFVMEEQREFFLEFPFLFNRAPFWVLVQSGFGHHQGSGTTELIPAND